MATPAAELRTKGAAAREAARALARLSAEVRNGAILNIASHLLEREAEVLAANRKDMEAGRRAGLSEALLDRLLLTHERLEGMAADVRQVATLPDPLGEVSDMRTLPNGLQLGRKRVPLGVIAAIYESRPNVTVDIASLCLKSGNACILRGGKEAIHSNTALATVVRDAVATAGAPQNAVQLIENTDRALVGEMLQMRDVVDLLIPRGGAELIRYVAENATMPVVTGGVGVCHTYVDAAADIGMAVEVAHNAKTRRPSICNALDTLLVHEAASTSLLPALGRRWAEAGVEMRCDERSLRILNAAEIPKLALKPAAQDDFGREFLALIAAVRVVDSLDEALAHIERHGSGHSEAILTADYAAAMRFLDEVDAAAVYVNASTQFTDGAQFGLGAEVGISTQKMHARGPMGPRELTSYKWIILGSGQTRPL
ncbi:MAG: glutamate-5-semialdehyde dehydrogenase [Dehalococcoidia bacterium]|nr:MAG: glutamate-5-semialdehyde dehydrogenase [Dehalococcoidia bacterium]